MELLTIFIEEEEVEVDEEVEVEVEEEVEVEVEEEGSNPYQTETASVLVEYPFRGTCKESATSSHVCTYFTH
ncbi:hypothetical protein Tco_0726156 [Tanacetum coccineum]|uniref:Uncharacterized protein n=1 Tax=Tanacetum coccineum TaxID=301880 RepID=A0ABQ4YEU8_9ASTR